MRRCTIIYLAALVVGCGSTEEPPPAAAQGDERDNDAGGSDASADAATGEQSDAAPRPDAGENALADAASSTGGDGDGDGGGGGDGDGDGDGDGHEQPPPPPAVGSAACASGGAPVIATPTDATGACAAPYVIDLGHGAFGDLFAHTTGTHPTDADAAPVGKCGEATQRDVVYRVLLPAATDLEISARAAEGTDVDIAIMAQRGPDGSCVERPTAACADDNGAGECEYLRLRVADGFADHTAQVIVSEYASSASPLSVHFRLVDPDGGS